jgi:hypothetical protein
MSDGPHFGEQPLPQTVAAAASMRRLTSLLLSLEHDHPTVEAMLTQFDEGEAELSPALPADPAPRMGSDPDGAHRVYLQHAVDVGSFNPCFPTYEFNLLEPDAAAGRVTFPVAYEGPPGSVQGGFLGVFFDCIVQHHNCATAPSGMTRTMTVTYRRHVPLLVKLDFDIVRVEVDRAVTSTARLLLDGQVLCVGEVDAVVVPSERLTGFDFGSRRSAAGTP